MSFLQQTSAFLAQATDQVEEAFHWGQLPPLWLVVLVVVPAVVLFVAFFYRREEPRGNSGWRIPLAGIRVLLILGVLAMLARPLLRRTSYETRDSTIVVMADESLSMGIVDRYSNRDVPEAIGDLLDMSPETVESTSRYDLLRDYLFADENLKLIESLQRKGKVVVSTFSSSPVEQVRLPKLKEGESPPPVDGTNSAAEILPSYDTIRAETRAQETRIGDSVSAAVTSIIGSGFGDEDERVSGVLLFTDGQENAGSAAIAEVARRLGERGTPIHVVGCCSCQSFHAVLSPCQQNRFPSQGVFTEGALHLLGPPQLRV